MSVVKSKRGESDLAIINKSRELAVYTARICSNEKNFPKRYRKENVTHEKRKLRRMKKLVDEGVLTKEHVDECYASWKAHAKQGNTYNLILSMNKFYKNLWKEGGNNV
jgi:DNA-binding Lrp family transcriptional regulator